MKFKLIIDPEKEEEVVVTARQSSPLIRQLEALVLQDTGPDRLIGILEDALVPLSPEEIECITVLERKTFAIGADGRKYRLKQRLYELEDRLPPCFIRINKSTLANEKRIARFAATFSGAVDAVFQCGYREYVSRRCFAEIKRRYDE